MNKPVPCDLRPDRRHFERLHDILGALPPPGGPAAAELPTLDSRREALGPGAHRRLGGDAGGVRPLPRRLSGRGPWRAAHGRREGRLGGPAGGVAGRQPGDAAARQEQAVAGAQEYLQDIAIIIGHLIQVVQRLCTVRPAGSS